MTIRPEYTSKAVDSLGRITLPKGLRDRLRIAPGVEMEIYTMEDSDGTIYIGLGFPQDKIATAKELLERNGYKVWKENT